MTDIFSIGIKIRFKGKNKLEARRPVTQAWLQGTD